VLVYGGLKNNYKNMYIKNNKLLVKKIWNKEISVWINLNTLTEKDILRLTQKEVFKIKEFENYKNFEKNIYNKNILENIIFSSKLFLNLEEFKKNKKENIYFNLGFIEKFVYESNRAEWSKIKEEDLIKIFRNKKVNYQNKNEILEVKNSIKAFEFMQEKFVFNVWNIKKVYHILTKNLVMNSWDKYPRWFKKIENTVNDEITSNPENVEKDIENLILWYKENKNKLFPLELAFIFHLKFQKIHPFLDWNWRVGRFLLNKILISNWYFPIIIFSNNKKSFFNSIKTPWIWNKKYFKFMLEQNKKTLNYFNKYETLPKT